MGVIELSENDEFAQQLQQAGSKAVFVDFSATWCGPCKAIAPVFEELSEIYKHAVFLKVDVDKLEDIAQSQGVTAMPTFMCFKNGQKLEEKRGADDVELKSFVKKWAGTGGAAGGDGSEDGAPKGQMDLYSLIDASGTECLNESDDHKLEHALDPESIDGYLESDVDEQLLITVAFCQQMKVHSFKIVANGAKAPKTVRLFVNLPNTPDFESAESMPALQEFTLTEDDMKADSLVNLKFVKFQSVISITMFIKDNQGGEETTKIDQLYFYGSPVSTTNMSEFKRVAGKKGESH